MRIDWYTKGVLTVIAVLLGVIAVRPYVIPDAVAHAQGSFAGVQFNYAGGANFFDSRSGEVFAYSVLGLEHKWRLTKLGEPLVKEK